jgi:hypothetical protein
MDVLERSIDMRITAEIIGTFFLTSRVESLLSMQVEKPTMLPAEHVKEPVAV